MLQGHIIVVDDNAGIRRLIYEILTQEGYIVETAENGMECLIKVQTNKPDLVILDAKMPGKNGLEIAKDLKKGNSHLPIIIITAYSEMNLINEAIESGIIEYYLTKPFDLNIIRNIVKSLLSK